MNSFPEFNASGIANALALSTMTPSYGNIYCHKMSHINTYECGAFEFYSGGGKLVPLNGIMGKITQRRFFSKQSLEDLNLLTNLHQLASLNL